jgi:hypothetical protein
MLQVNFFCRMWRHTMTRYCGQKGKDNMSSHGVRAYPWIKKLVRLSVCLCVCLCICPHGITVGVSIAWIYLKKFTRYLLIFVVAYPIFQYPLLFPSLHMHNFSPVLNSYVCTTRLHTPDFSPVLNSYICTIRQIIQKLNNLFPTRCHPSWSTFVHYRNVMYI